VTTGSAPARSTALPAGTVTFLFTDVEGSTRLAAELEHRWLEVIETHNAVLRAVWTAHNGYEVHTAGDSFFVAFASAADGLAAAMAAQRALAEHDWSPNPQVKVRMGLHTGDALVHDRDYVGLQVHVAARVSAAAHGGQILVSGATRTAAGNPDGGWRDLGFHRLKDLPAELRLYQLDVDGLPIDFPPVRSLDVFRNNIPAPTSAFVGRDDERDGLHNAIDSNRLVTLTGAGGAGKTRLATETALDRLDRHADGVWLVELDGVFSNEDAVITAVADVFRLHEEAGVVLRDAVVAHLRERDLLLIVDNCEHVIDPVSRVVEIVLQSCEHVRVLATSREPLGLPGELSWPVEPLLTDTAQSDGVRLFLDRVRLIRPDAVERPEAVDAAVMLCRQLDGLPLAIELAAARARALTIEQIAARIDDRFRLLTTGSRTATPRQQTLRGAVDWSYELLDSDERTVFHRLSVFAGEFDVEAAELVASNDAVKSMDVLDHLASLVEKSLVVVSSAGRYRMLRTIRAYAAERLAASGETGSVARAHAAWIAHRLRDDAYDSGFNVVAANNDDVAAAIDWALTQESTLGCEMVKNACGFWMRQVRWSDVCRYVDQAITSGGTDVTMRSDLLNRGIEASLSLGRLDEARRYADDALRVAREAGDPKLESSVLSNLGVIAYQQGDYVTAEAILQQALAAQPEQDAKALSHLALVAHNRGDSDLAEERSRAALANARATGDTECITVNLNLLGVLASNRGDMRAARQYYDEALALAREHGDRRATIYLLYCLGSLAVDTGDTANATAFLAEGIDVALAFASRLDLAELLEATARFAVMTGATSDAAHLIGHVDAVRDELAFPRSAAELPSHQRLVDAARAGLGDVAFADAFSAGRELSLDDAVSVAIRRLGR
jgi:predicted ATPase/class 3 adenylate cyclase